MKGIMWFCRAFILVPHESTALRDKILPPQPFWTWAAIELFLWWGEDVRLICTVSSHCDDIDSITSIYFWSFSVYRSFTFFNYHSKWKGCVWCHIHSCTWVPPVPSVTHTPCPNCTQSFALFFQLCSALHFATIFWCSKDKNNNVLTNVFVGS